MPVAAAAAGRQHGRDRSSQVDEAVGDRPSLDVFIVPGLIDRLAGRELAVATARQIEYAWQPDGGIVIEARAAEHA